jgi:hypothetical protein
MKRRLVRVLAALMVCSALPALASVVVAMSIEEMTQASPLVVRGRVGQIQVSWDEGERKIWTRAEIQVLEALKGRTEATLLVRQPGGEVGNKGQHVEGAGQFTTGEEGLFFLEPAADEPGTYTLYALAAGKVGFEKSKAGELRAVRRLEGLVFYAPATKKVVTPVTQHEDLGTPESFVARVKKAIGGAR